MISRTSRKGHLGVLLTPLCDCNKTPCDLDCSPSPFLTLRTLHPPWAAIDFVGLPATAKRKYRLAQRSEPATFIRARRHDVPKSYRDLDGQESGYNSSLCILSIPIALLSGSPRDTVFQQILSATFVARHTRKASFLKPTSSLPRFLNWTLLLLLISFVGPEQRNARVLQTIAIPELLD